MISFHGVDKDYEDPRGNVVRAVRDLNLEVAEGEVHCLLGSSGCGKTTTLRMVNRLEEPTRGRILLGGRDVAQQDLVRLRRGIGYVIQSGGLFPHLSVARNIGLLCQLEGWPASATRERVQELLRLVGLDVEEHAERHPGELSGGQRQRVGVARALALDPPVVLMDEPFGALDPITRGQLHREFQTLLAAVRKTVLLVTHDLAEAFLLGDRISLMHEGVLVQSGSADDFQHRPASDFVAEFVAAHFAGPAAGPSAGPSAGASTGPSAAGGARDA